MIGPRAIAGPGRPSPWRSVALAIGLMILGVACTLGGDAEETDDAPASSVPATPGPAEEPLPPPAEASELPGRLLVKLNDGGLATVRPDGADLRIVAVAVRGEVQVLQAAWAPDGRRVAWGQIGADGGVQTPSVVTSRPHGRDAVATPTDAVPFYLSWDPTSSRVGFLGSDGTDRFRMGVVERAGTDEGSARSLARGSPFFFAWAPDGDRVLAHVGDERLDEITLDGGTSSVGDGSGRFQAPAWSADGRSQVYAEATERGERQRVIVRGPDGGRRVVARADGAVSLVLSPDGSRLAFQALNADERNLLDRTLPNRAVDVGVTIVDLETGAIERATIRPAAAFFWDPTGERLAILEPTYHPSTPMPFRWVVWDGDGGFVTPPFVPGRSLLGEYTPFFSQYAQSLTVWAPDGGAFAYPVEHPSEPTTIWVQPTDADASAYRLGFGSFAAWSPR
jgi:hypothetical protein